MIICDCGGAHVDVEAPRQGPRLTLGSPKESGLENLWEVQKKVGWGT